MMPEKTRPINRVVLLVHPFFSNPHIRGSVEDKHRAATFLLWHWRNQLKEAALDPYAIAIIVESKWFRHIRESGEAKKIMKEYVDKDLAPRVDRLFAMATRGLGDRLFIVDTSFRLDDISTRIRERGFKLGTRWRGKAFGEYLNLCVSVEAKLLASHLGVKPRRIKRVPGISVKSIDQVSQLAHSLRRTPRKRA